MKREVETNKLEQLLQEKKLPDNVKVHRLEGNEKDEIIISSLKEEEISFYKVGISEEESNKLQFHAIPDIFSYMEQLDLKIKPVLPTNSQERTVNHHERKK